MIKDWLKPIPNVLNPSINQPLEAPNPDPDPEQKSPHNRSNNKEEDKFEEKDKIVVVIEMSEKIYEKFDGFHGTGARLCEAPFEQLFDVIMKEYPTFLPKVVKLYCKVKFYARLKQLNYDLKISKLNKTVRSYKQNAQFNN